MSYLAKFKKEDFIKMSWEDYGKILENLGQKVEKYVKENNIKIDAVVPILRGGMFSWEDIEEEWTTVEGKQFEYEDLNKAIENSETKVVIKN